MDHANGYSCLIQCFKLCIFPDRGILRFFALTGFVFTTMTDACQPPHFSQKFSHRQNADFERNFGLLPAPEKALCHLPGIFHKAVELWKTFVEKPVENVENFDFSTGIFLPSPSPGPVQKIRGRRSGIFQRRTFFPWLAKTQPAAVSRKKIRVFPENSTRRFVMGRPGGKFFVTSSKGSFVSFSQSREILVVRKQQEDRLCREK